MNAQQAHRIARSYALILRVVLPAPVNLAIMSTEQVVAVILMNALWAYVVAHAQTLRVVIHAVVSLATSKMAHNVLILMSVKMGKMLAVSKYALILREVIIVTAALAIA